MSSDRYFLCASEFQYFWSPIIPKGMSILKKTGYLTKNFKFFHWYYLRSSQKCLFFTFWCRNGNSNMTSHVTLACTILLFLSFLLELYTKFKCVKTFGCILKVFCDFSILTKMVSKRSGPLCPVHTFIHFMNQPVVKCFAFIFSLCWYWTSVYSKCQIRVYFQYYSDNNFTVLGDKSLTNWVFLNL